MILDAAEEIAADGLEALSMRSVAARVEAAPMALYNHFATKDQLVDGLLDRVLMRFRAPAPTDDWEADLRRFARAHRSLLVRHPWAVSTLFSRPNPGLGSVRIGEAALEILQRGGFSNDTAVAAFSGIIALNYGWSSFTTARDLDPVGPSHDVAAMLGALPPEEFPLTVRVAATMGGYGSDRHYEYVLDALVRGLAGA